MQSETPGFIKSKDLLPLFEDLLNDPTMDKMEKFKVWNKYLVRIRDTSKTRYPELLKQFIIEYQDYAWAKDNPKLVNRVIEYAKYDPEPLNFFYTANKANIGTKDALFYQYWAMEYEKAGMLDKSVEVCTEGLKRTDSNGVDELEGTIERIQRKMKAGQYDGEENRSQGGKKRKFGDLLTDSCEILRRMKNTERNENNPVLKWQVSVQQKAGSLLEGSPETTILTFNPNFLQDSQKENRCPTNFTQQEDNISRTLNFDQSNEADGLLDCIEDSGTFNNGNVMVDVVVESLAPKTQEEASNNEGKILSPKEKKRSPKRKEKKKDRTALGPICEDSEYLEIDSPAWSVDSSNDKRGEEIRENEDGLPFGGDISGEYI